MFNAAFKAESERSAVSALLATVLTAVALVLVPPRFAQAAATFVVTNTNDSGVGSLRAALAAANATPNVGGPDLVTFAIPGAGPFVISPNGSNLPALNEPAVDATTQPGQQFGRRNAKDVRALSTWTSYNAAMSSLANVKVSNRGQMSLPASARKRWGFDDGGEVGVIDLDGALLLVPGGIQAAKRALHSAISEGRYERAVAQIADPDLAN